jgi:hypothetical protein
MSFLAIACVALIQDAANLLTSPGRGLNEAEELKD